MNMLYIIVVFGVLVLFIIGVFAFLKERKAFNKGKCPNCDISWVLFDRDSRGSRGYKCTKCHKTFWISYPFIDSIFRKEY